MDASDTPLPNHKDFLVLEQILTALKRYIQKSVDKVAVRSLWHDPHRSNNNLVLPFILLLFSRINHLSYKLPAFIFLLPKDLISNSEVEKIDIRRCRVKTSWLNYSQSRV